MFKRNLPLPPPGEDTFFLWGPRQIGKTTLLRQCYPGARWVDLLKATSSAATRQPGAVARGDRGRRNGAGRAGGDRRDPEGAGPARRGALADREPWRPFRAVRVERPKVRRGAAKPARRRALRFELRGLTAAEIGDGFDLTRMLNHGYLPRMVEAAAPARRLDAYVANYLREEVAAEGLVRNLPAFSGFLNAAALCDGELINFSNVAADCGVSSHTARRTSRFSRTRCSPVVAGLPQACQAAGRRAPSSISRTWVS